jgi:hypothetical protein
MAGFPSAARFLMSEVNVPPSATVGDALHGILEAADSPLAALERVAGDTTVRLAALQSALGEQRGRIADLERQLGLAEARLLVETMHAAGLAAQAAHLLGLGPDVSVATEPSGEHYSDGAPKTRLALVYEAAFDAKGHELGVAEPEQFRDG